jgi:quercetin dioxygenase-like cupin family protein
MTTLSDISFLYIAADEGGFAPGALPGLEYRDLSAAAATGGRLGAWEVRPSGDGHVAWRAYDVELHAVFVVHGSVRIDCGAGNGHSLSVGDVLVLPGRFPHGIQLSVDARLIELRFPADGALIEGQEAERLEGPGGAIVNYDVPEAYRVGASPTASRQFLRYRDVGVPESVSNDIRLEVIRAESGGHSSGWHHHPMAQIVFGVQGSAMVDVDGHGAKALAAGSVIYLPAGLAHNLRDITDDYGLLEAFIPALGGTVQCDPPVGAVGGADR